MTKLPKKYIKPKITEKKIKLNYFFRPTAFLDQFNIVGDVYASSPNDDDGGGTSTGTSGGTSGGGSSSGS